VNSKAECDSLRSQKNIKTRNKNKNKKPMPT